jgi:hypothetical protein
MAQRLLAVAMKSPKKLKLIAEILDEEEMENPRQANIIGAYLACFTTKGCLPTLREVREKLVAKLDERNWPANFSLRKTLKSLNLPLAKGRRGPRPRGSRSQIGNSRRVEQ